MTGNGSVSVIRSRTAALGVGPAVGMSVVAVILLAAWRPGLPDAIATHWGHHGVDGTNSFSRVCATVGVVVAVALAVGAVTSCTARAVPMLAATLAIINGLVVFLVAFMLGVTGAQLGHHGAPSAAVPALWFVFGMILGLVVAVATAIAASTWCLRRDPPNRR